MAFQVPPPLPPFHVQDGSPGQWTTSLYGCFEDCNLFCVTCWCPCKTFGEVAEIIDRGSTSRYTSAALYAAVRFFTGCQCVYSLGYRSRMRAQYNLPTQPCADCCVHCCCELRSLCQMHRELTNRGYDMNIGWQGNLDRWQGRAGVPMYVPMAAPPLPLRDMIMSVPTAPPPPPTGMIMSVPMPAPPLPLRGMIR